jgi:hypothetical protein
MSVVRAAPLAMNKSAPATTGRMPQRSIIAAANGPTNPKRTRLIETARETVARDHPNSPSSGTISTPGVERVPDAASRVMNVTAKTIQA